MGALTKGFAANQSVTLHVGLDSAETTIMDLRVQLSSCVPATAFETSAANIDNVLVSALSGAAALGAYGFRCQAELVAKRPGECFV